MRVQVPQEEHRHLQVHNIYFATCTNTTIDYTKTSTTLHTMKQIWSNTNKHHKRRLHISNYTFSPTLHTITQNVQVPPKVHWHFHEFSSKYTIYNFATCTNTTIGYYICSSIKHTLKQYVRVPPTAPKNSQLHISTHSISNYTTCTSTTKGSYTLSTTHFQPRSIQVRNIYEYLNRQLHMSNYTIYYEAGWTRTTECSCTVSTPTPCKDVLFYSALFAKETCIIGLLLLFSFCKSD